VKKLYDLIDKTLIEIDRIVPNSKGFKMEKEPILSTVRVLNLLKKEIEHNPGKINERVLRAMHDVGMSSYKEFENTPIEGAINGLTGFLYDEIPQYRKLEPLRSDFGKGNPI